MAKIAKLSFLINPTAGLIIGILISLLCKADYYEIGRLEFVLNALITSSTTLNGFILTSISIFVSMGSNEVFKAICKNGNFPELTCRYTETLATGLAVMILSIILGSASIDGDIIARRWIIIMPVLLVYYILSFATTSRYLLWIFSLLHGNKMPRIDNEASSPVDKFV